VLKGGFEFMERHTVKVRTDSSGTVPAAIKNPKTKSLFTSEIENELDAREAEVEKNGVADSKLWRTTGRAKKAAVGKR